MKTPVVPLFALSCLLGAMVPFRIATAAHDAASAGTKTLATASAADDRDTRAGAASATMTASQVVEAHARAWSTRDLPGLLALFDDDARSYDRSADPHMLSGKRSNSIGDKRRLEAYFRETYAVQAPSRESIASMAVVGDLVVAAGESAQAPDFATRMRFLTAFRVRHGRIHDLWHIAWLPVEASSGAGPAEVIRQLIAARTAGDAGRFLALFSPEAKHFCPSADPRKLADRQCDGSTDATGREAFMRNHPGQEPLRIEVVALFSAGDLVVQQSRVTGLVGRPGEAVDQVSIYRVRDGRIVDTWLLGEEIPAAAARGDAS